MLPVTSLMSAVTTGTSVWVPVQGAARDLVFTVTGAGTISAGTLLYEETDDVGSGATASQLASITCADVTGGAKKCTHIAVGCALYVRARLSVNVSGAGGLVTVTVAGA
jgi:hypothetical protein